MKPIYVYLGGALALTFTIAACVPAPDSTPPPSPAPAPTPTSTPMPTTPAPTSPAPPATENWIDQPRTPGDWTYRSEATGGIALYGENPAETRFSIACNRSGNRVILTRAGQPRGQVSMTIRTETTDRSLSARPTADGQPTVTASLSARDPLLDAMAITRGRFAVEVPGLSTIYLPPWAEVSRVVEECR